MSTTKAPIQKNLKKAITLLKKKYEAPGKRASQSVLEALVLSILCEGTTEGKAQPAFERLKSDYFDWNEVRVSAAQELVEVLSDLPDREVKATRLRGALKYGFETTYSFDFDVWRKGKLKETIKKLAKLPWASDYVVARLVRDGLGGHAVPLDSLAIRVLSRLDLLDTSTALDQFRARLERIIPKGRSVEFTHLVSQHAVETCLDVDPHCKHCVLLDVCPFGQRRLKEQAAAAAEAKSGRKSARS
jgi:endonuclease-3